MIIKAKSSVQLRGHIYRKGEAAEWNGAITPRIAALFTLENGAPLVAESADGKKDEPDTQETAPDVPTADELIKRTVGALKRDGIIRQLDGMGVTYAPSANTKYLAKLLLMSKGEIKEM